ncbi:carbohydrate sulfotransferase 15-like [Littorina saxatilis]|uniref:Sulfotransferase n=1 Tax=Littorina saxatilis TaxID=31220 RepID=A0AAN9AX16_9CAEN
MLSLGLGGSPSDVVSGKSKKKLKKAKKGGGGPPEVLQKFVPPTEETKVYEWFDTSYKQSKAFGKAKEFVEDEPLFGSCSKSLVAVRPWGETFLTLGPFRYLGRSKNPCWYPDNGGKFTCIPYFFLAGAAGPGTDDVMSKILIHPHVIGKKEQQHWWDLGRHAGVPWETYCQAYQEQTDQILLDINDHKSSDKVYGDSTATYFASPTGWERLSGNENCDEPRIILASHLRRLRVKGLVITVLPHPTRRILADFRKALKGKPINPGQFDALVKKSIDAYKGCFAKYSMRQCAYNKTLADSVKLSLHEGMYSIYMEDWVRIFPPEQFMVIRFEDYVANTVPTLEKMYDFLGIPQIEPTELAIAADPTTKEFRDLVKNHNPGTILPQTINMLNEFYAPFLKRLGEIMKDPVKFTWKDT